MSLDVSRIRPQFPALTSGAAFFDNPGGTQVPQRVLDRMTEYLKTSNANLGGAFPTSLASEELVEQGRQALADFLNAGDAREIVFGPNMTSLTFALSRALAQEWQPGDEIVVTRLDHDANITPWVLAAQERGCHVRWLNFDVEDCTLRIEQLEGLLGHRTRLVAVGYASNAVGTINDIPRVIRMAHQAGALCFIDAVHYAPHGPIDVQALNCDFMAASTYKFFGPHLGVLYGRYELLDRLPAYRVRPAPQAPPGKFETGTQNHEGIAGALGAMDYLAWLGREFGMEHAERFAGAFSGRRLALKQALAAVRAYEMELTRKMSEALASIPGLRIYGITENAALDLRVPTFSFRLDGYHPRQVAERLGQAGVYVWDGNYYAVAVTERLGVEERGGMVRAGAVHYNTPEEVERLGEALRALREEHG